MIEELIYTSAPKGLKPGSKGFCTVASTSGMAQTMASMLESLSGYRHLGSPGSQSESVNPTVYSHLQARLGGRSVSILSRIANAGLDYSGRSNKLAHHVALPANAINAAGPVATQQLQGFHHVEWAGEPQPLNDKPSLPQLSVPAGVCDYWKAIAGDAGWGGVCAERMSNQKRQHLWIIYRPDVDMLRLLGESLALLPQELRWCVTYSTFYTKLPPGMDCTVRCVVDGTPEANQIRKRYELDVIDLCSPLGTPPPDIWTKAATRGITPVTSVPKQSTTKTFGSPSPVEHVEDEYEVDLDDLATPVPPPLPGVGQDGPPSLVTTPAYRRENADNRQAWMIAGVGLLAVVLLLGGITAVMWPSIMGGGQTPVVVTDGDDDNPNQDNEDPKSGANDDEPSGGSSPKEIHPDAPSDGTKEPNGEQSNGEKSEDGDNAEPESHSDDSGNEGQPGTEAEDEGSAHNNIENTSNSSSGNQGKPDVPSKAGELNPVQETKLPKHIWIVAETFDYQQDLPLFADTEFVSASLLLPEDEILSKAIEKKKGDIKEKVKAIFTDEELRSKEIEDQTQEMLKKQWEKRARDLNLLALNVQADKVEIHNIKSLPFLGIQRSKSGLSINPAKSFNPSYSNTLVHGLLNITLKPKGESVSSDLEQHCHIVFNKPLRLAKPATSLEKPWEVSCPIQVGIGDDKELPLIVRLIKKGLGSTEQLRIRVRMGEMDPGRLLITRLRIPGYSWDLNVNIKCERGDIPDKTVVNASAAVPEEIQDEIEARRTFFSYFGQNVSWKDISQSQNNNKALREKLKDGSKLDEFRELFPNLPPPMNGEHYFLKSDIERIEQDLSKQDFHLSISIPLEQLLPVGAPPDESLPKELILYSTRPQDLQRFETR